MSGTDIKAIAPGAIEDYAGKLNSGVDGITNGLNDLCRSITNVDYGGRNAFKFKSDSSTLANNLSTQIFEAISGLGRSVAQATSDLSGSLGGSAITINLQNNTITPADAGADSAEGAASVSGLQTLSSQVETAFATINTGIGKVADMPPNSRNGWMGDRRIATETVVTDFVQMATKSCEKTKTTLTEYIQSQITAIESQ